MAKAAKTVAYVAVFGAFAFVIGISVVSAIGW